MIVVDVVVVVDRTGNWSDEVVLVGKPLAGGWFQSSKGNLWSVEKIGFDVKNETLGTDIANLACNVAGGRWCNENSAVVIGPWVESDDGDAIVPLALKCWACGDDCDCCCDDDADDGDDGDDGFRALCKLLGDLARFEWTDSSTEVFFSIIIESVGGPNPDGSGVSVYRATVLRPVGSREPR